MKYITSLTNLIPEPCSKDEVATMLDNMPWGQGFEWVDLLDFAHYLHLYKVAPDTAIFCEGHKEPYMGFVVKGEARVEKKDDHSNAVIIAKLGAGKTFGEMSLIDGQPRSATVVTVSQLEFLALFPDEFSGLCEHKPQAAVKFMMEVARQMSARLRQTSGRLVDFLPPEK
ncbi:MAG: cyclic nucleotide-binding domain-containing protein [bacterium]|nr:cyclic nucleotide-binding domain-containing protein [bacterium]